MGGGVGGAGLLQGGEAGSRPWWAGWGEPGSYKEVRQGAWETGEGRQVKAGRHCRLEGCVISRILRAVISGV